MDLMKRIVCRLLLFILSFFFIFGVQAFAGTGGKGKPEARSVQQTTQQTQVQETDVTDYIVHNYNNIVNQNLGTYYQSLGTFTNFVYRGFGGAIQVHRGWRRTYITYNPNPDTPWFPHYFGGRIIGFWFSTTSSIINVGSYTQFLGSYTFLLGSYLKDLGNTVTFVGDTTNQSVSHHRNSQNIQLTSGESLIAINTDNQTVTITTTHHYQRTHHIEKNNYYLTVKKYRNVVQQKKLVTYVLTVYHYNIWVYPYSPIILDLDGSGEPDVANHEWLPHAPKFYTQHMTVFDMIGNGVPILTEWVGPHAGILCVPDQNGKVTSALQLFGTAGGFDDGYEKLSLLDKNHDGVLTGDELKGLYVMD